MKMEENVKKEKTQKPYKKVKKEVSKEIKKTKTEFLRKKK